MFKTDKLFSLTDVHNLLFAFPACLEPEYQQQFYNKLQSEYKEGDVFAIKDPSQLLHIVISVIKDFVNRNENV